MYGGLCLILKVIFNFGFLIRANDGVELTGWGSMSTLGETTTKLQATRLIVDPQNACNNSYNLNSGHPKSLEIELVLPNLIQPNLLCAASSVCTNSKNYINISILYTYISRR